MPAPTWEQARWPLSFLVGAGIAFYAVVFQDSNPAALAFATVCMGLPTALIGRSGDKR